MTMSDRIAVMNKGHYEQLGDPETLYERPATRFVAGFLGISNLIGGRVAGSDGEEWTSISLDNGVAVRAPRALADGKTSILLGVRPEKIRLYEMHETVPDGFNRMNGTIRAASYMGVSTQYQVDVPGDRRLTVFEQNVERATKAELWEPGEEAVVAWQPRHSFVVKDEGGDAPVEDVTEEQVAFTEE